MRSLAFFLGVSVLLLSPRAFSDDKEEAKQRYHKGKAFVEEGAYDKAIIELKASYDLNPVPIVQYNIAVCYDELKQYANALKHYRSFVAESKDAPEAMKNEVAKRIEELDEFIGLLKVEVDVEGAEVLIDDKLVGHTPVKPIIIETGEHDLNIRKTGLPEIKRKFTIVSGKIVELSLKMEQKEEKGAGEQPL